MTRHRWVSVERHQDERGSLIVLDDSTDTELTVRRTYTIWGVPEGAIRGGHAHRELHQIIVPVTGGVTVVVDDGENEQTYRLNDPSRGLFLGRMVWRELQDFTSDAMILVGASLPYDPEDYIHGRDRFHDEYAAEVVLLTLL